MLSNRKFFPLDEKEQCHKQPPSVSPMHGKFSLELASLKTVPLAWLDQRHFEWLFLPLQPDD